MYAGNSTCRGKPCVSWGHHLNVTFQDLLNQIHDTKLSEDIIFIQGDSKIVKADRVFLPRFGYCKEISHYNPKFGIGITNNHTNTNLRIFLTDRLHKSYFSINFLSHIGDKVVIPYGTAFYTNIKTKIKTNCKVMDTKQTFDFEKCVDEKLQSDLKKILGCVPPWKSDNNKCKGTYNLSQNKTQQYFEHFILPLEQLRNIQIESECKLCSATKIIVNVQDELISYEGWGKYGEPSIRAILFFDPNTTVTETVLNYKWFNFIVDVGSSFGTWLGLSMLSTCDFLDIAVKFVQNNNLLRKWKSATTKQIDKLRENKQQCD